MQNITKIILLLMVIGFSAPVSAVSAQKLKLTAEQSSHQFPFFDTQTPVWAYNDSIPGPIIRGKEGQIIDIEFINNMGSRCHPEGTIRHRVGDESSAVAQ